MSSSPSIERPVTIALDLITNIYFSIPELLRCNTIIMVNFN